MRGGVVDDLAHRRPDAARRRRMALVPIGVVQQGLESAAGIAPLLVFGLGGGQGMADYVQQVK